MIPKREILVRSQEWSLRPEVVEKDYVLGWMLAAIASAGDRGASGLQLAGSG